jgi:ubiquinone/menaquinone biosynthesis C-methylase UbiE
MKNLINTTESQNKRYQQHFDLLKENLDPAQAAELAVGGRFDEIGKIELEILKENGLTRDMFVIDVGCGSGRLANQLSIYGLNRYLGTDVVDGLLDYAGNLVGDKDLWLLKKVDNIEVPTSNNSADFICFFSVFTHLLHEQTFLYLKEAKRVLKPGGKVIFSFLEFEVPSHWAIFEGNLDKFEENHLNMFFDREAINAWSNFLGMSVEKILQGDQPQIAKDINESRSLGQSIAVLKKTSSP